jgi:N-acetylneuraminic acid mutarotase
MWHNKAPIPGIGILNFGNFVIDSDYYVVGGNDSIQDFLNGVWKYNIPTDTWRQLGNLPFGQITCLTAFTLNGKGYVCTGIDSLGSYICDTLMWEYDPATDTWTRRASFPGSGRELALSVTYHNKAYVGLGYACGAPVTDFWEYDPITDHWTQRDSLPSEGRVESGIAIVDSIIYTMAGTDIQNSDHVDMWGYNIVTNRWLRLADLPGPPRRAPVTFSFDSFFLAGYGNMYTNFGPHDLYKYDIAHNKWDTVICLNFIDSSSIGGGSFVLGKQAYFFSGLFNDTTIYHDMWTADASSLFHETKDTTGIATVKQDELFSVYPNPVSREKKFSISTSEIGEVVFTDELGRTLDDRKLNRGVNSIKLATDDEVVFYRAVLYDGTIKNGKVILY